MSYLLIEAGRSTVRAALVETVEGQHRFVASGQAGIAFGEGRDVTVGIREAVSAIESVIGRRLHAQGRLIVPERPDGSGVEGAVLVSGEVLRVATVGLTPSLSTLAANRAAGTAGAVLVGSVSPADPSGASPLEQMLEIIRDRSAHVILLAGGTDGGSEAPVEDLARTLGAALELSDGRRPAVLFAGNAALRDRLGDLLGEETDLRYVANVLPWVGEESPEAALGGLRQTWRDRLLAEVPGYEAAQSWSNRPALPSAGSFADALRFLAVRRGMDVWGIDVGCSTTTLVAARPGDARVVLREVGIGKGAVSLGPQGGANGRLVPGVSQERERDLLWNRLVRPWARSESPEERALVASLVREAARKVLSGSDETPAWSGGVGLLVARGGPFAGVLAPKDVARALLDGLNPSGVFELALDRHQLLPGLGALATLAPQAAAEALIADGTGRLGTVVALSGWRTVGNRACSVELRRQGGKPERLEVRGGESAALQLDGDESADLAIRPARDLDCGWGRGRSVTVRVRGGPLGVLVDAGVRQAGDGETGSDGGRTGWPRWGRRPSP